MDAYEMAKAAGAFGVADELERLKVERDEAWSAANSAEAKLAEALKRIETFEESSVADVRNANQAWAEVERLRAEMKHNDPASYSSMVQWREKCYEARAEVERLREYNMEHTKLMYAAQQELQSAEAGAEQLQARCNSMAGKNHEALKAIDKALGTDSGARSELGRGKAGVGYMGAWGALKLLLKRYAEAEAEVERLRGLIVSADDEFSSEEGARDGWAVFVAEARAIRALRGEEEK